MNSDATKRRRKWKRWVLPPLLILLASILFLGWLMGEPMYRVGSVRDLGDALAPPPQTVAGRWRMEADIELAHQSSGQGPIQTLVIHGGPGVPEAAPWAALDAFRDTHQFHFYHQRGCGESSRPFDRFDGSYYQNLKQLESRLGIGAQLADIERIRRILGVEKLVLIGHSFGGLIAALYAAEFPEYVDRLVLIAPAGLLTPPAGERDLFQQVRQQLTGKDLEAFEKDLADYFDFGGVFEKDEHQLAQQHAVIGGYLLEMMGAEAPFASSPPCGGWAVMATYFSLGQRPNFAPAIARIPVPTWILLGTDDRWSRAGAESYLVIPNTQLIEIPRDSPERQAGHFVFREAPRSFAQTLRAAIDAEFGPSASVPSSAAR